jgi:predicted O-methyltransferase YrrM
MKPTWEYSSLRYLNAKTTIDDRSLNTHVLTHIKQRLRALDGPLKVLEVGGGLGSMIDRLSALEVINTAHYTIVEMDPAHTEHASIQIRRWAEKGISAEIHLASIEDWLDTHRGQKFDLIVAHAVLDLMDLDRVIPGLLSRLHPDGIFWSTVNFDGDTIFQPDDPADEALVQRYHASMDNRMRDGQKIGDSRTGRHLFQAFRKANGEIQAAGSSDWVIYSNANSYRDDEAYFLQCIIHFFENELSRHPEVGHLVAPWVERRLAQIERGELVYIAHQLDYAVGPGLSQA